MPKIVKRGFTFDEFCVVVKDGQKADLIEGTIYMASPENTDANDLFFWLGGLMYDYAQSKDLGRVCGSRVAFRLDEKNAPEPDLAFVRKDRVNLFKRGFVEGPPDLAVEIVSPESVERDYGRKRTQYQQAGVSEYWIVDEIVEKVVLLRLSIKGTYREVRPKKGVFQSEVFSGFWLLAGWLWQRPLPNKIEKLTEILSKQP